MTSRRRFAPAVGQGGAPARIPEGSPGRVMSARYFPVRDAPLRMEARLRPFGTDFGNGRLDTIFFQLDERYDADRLAKRQVDSQRDGVLLRNEGERSALRSVAAWMRECLALEHPGLPVGEVPGDDPGRALAAIAEAVQEDFAVVRRDRETGNEAAIAVFVSFPSGWRPERILGASFREIHGPVPAFAEEPRQARSMVASMIERGPYVRFVWTVTADDHLDHHPDEGHREPWDGNTRGWLRVERQVTVPFREEDASLFLIRTHLYPFDELTRDQRVILARALAAMPAAVARYKGLDGAARSFAIAKLG